MNKFAKLLKYDFLENLSSFLLINGALLIIIFITQGATTRDSMLLMALVGVVQPGILLLMVFLGITIIKLLYRRLFSNDAYLTFSLPVSLDAILISKILVSCAWIIISAIVVVVWLVFLKDLIFPGMESNPARIFEGHPLEIAAGLANGLFYITSRITLVLLILAILHIGKITHLRALAGILIFMGFMILESVANTAIYSRIPKNSGDFGTTINFCVGAGIHALKTLIYYACARYLIKNKLEI